MCSLDSSTMEEGEASRLEAEFTGPGVLEFDVSMENDSEDNRLTYMVDGQTVRTLSGSSTNGTKHRTELSEGKHKVSWVYKKNTSSSAVPTVNNIQFRKTGDSTQTPSNNAESGSGGGGAMGLPFWMSLFGLTLIRRFFK